MVMLKILQPQQSNQVVPANHYKNKVIIVTGGASGIGRALCEELGRRGAKIIALDINETGCQQVVASIVANGGQAEAKCLDVSNATQFQTLIDCVVADYGQLDFIFNNAGIAVSGDMRDLTLEHWQKIVDINLWGVLHGTMAAYKVMTQQGFGHIVNTSSLSGIVPSPMLTPYAVTKHAVVGLSNSLRCEAESLGVKVSVVCSGYIQTGIFDGATIVGADKEDVLAKLSFQFMTPEKAVKIILQDVQRNRAMIVFPFFAKLLWQLTRIDPVLISPLTKAVVKEFRALHAKHNDNTPKF